MIAKIDTARPQSTYSQSPPMIVAARINAPATKFRRAKLHTPATDQLADCV